MPKPETERQRAFRIINTVCETAFYRDQRGGLKSAISALTMYLTDAEMMRVAKAMSDKPTP
jgi:hypothetical protein